MDQHDPPPHNPYQPPQLPPRSGLHLGDEPLVFAQTPQQRNDGPRGLGGWLILVGIGLVLTPVKNAMVLFTLHLPLFFGDAWEQLTMPGNEHYHPMYAPLIAFETIGNGAFVLFGLTALVLFFRKSRRFPRWMIALQVANVLFAVGDMVLGMQIPEVAQSPDEGVKYIVRASVGALIWIPYMLTSKRVRNTFVGPVRPTPRIEPRWDETERSAGTA